MSEPAGDEPGRGTSEEGRLDGTPPVAPRGVRLIAGEEFSFAEAVGGVRGLIESALPGLVFVLVYVPSRALVPALVASLALALVAVVVRLAQRTPVTQAFSGVLGVVIGVVWASRTGEASDFFAWGLIVNIAWCVGAAVSVLVRWPAVGVVVSLVRGQDMSWRTDPGARGMRRRYVRATWLWAALFGARLGVQIPLYLQGADAVGWLGTAKIVMGVPLFAVGLWLTWLMVRESGAARAPSRPRRDR